MSLSATSQTGGVAATGVSAGSLSWRMLLGQTLTAYGELYISSSAATTVSDTTSYFDLDGTWTLGNAVAFDENTNGKLRYTGTATAVVFVVASVSVASAGVNDLIHLRLEKNGASVTGSESSNLLGAAGDTRTMAITGVISLATNDEVGLAVRNESAAADITAAEGHLMLLAFTS